MTVGTSSQSVSPSLEAIQAMALPAVQIIEPNTRNTTEHTSHAPPGLTSAPPASVRLLAGFALHASQGPDWLCGASVGWATRLYEPGLRAQANTQFRWKMRNKGYGFLSYHCHIPVRHCLMYDIVCSGLCELAMPGQNHRPHVYTQRDFPSFLRAPFMSFSSMPLFHLVPNDWRSLPEV